MKIKDSYLTLKADSEGLYKEKGSKFLSFAFVIDDEVNVKKRLLQLKKKYHDARHHCYAYVLGHHGKCYRANDDGEPGHSAGDPILGQIRSNNLTNTLIVVVRYFGGTKLGISGLIHAYRSAAAKAIENNVILEKPILSKLHIQFEYAHLDKVMKLVKHYDLITVDKKMEVDCTMELAVRLGLADEVKAKISNMNGIFLKDSND